MEQTQLFSGIQPTGTLHIGNYFGAMRRWVDFQKSHDALYCIVDLHAITIPQDSAVLQRNIIDTAKWYLAAGIDPVQSVIFVQSDVAAHTELAWILNTVARMGDMEKMTQFKDKSAKDGAQRASVGLFDYPVLMAADILLYGTAAVPVGDDQVQHIELTRTLARRFNKRFGETFVVPRALVASRGARVMGLDNPHKKMSKSAQSAYSYIALSDDAETIRKKVCKAVTDSDTTIIYDEARPALRNLLDLYHLATGVSVEEIAAQYETQGYGAFKEGLADALIAHLAPIQERFATLDDAQVRAVLRDGAMRAQTRARETIATVYARMGLGSREACKDA